MSNRESVSSADLLASESNVHWKDCVQAAMREQDTTKILTLIHAAEASLMHRRRRVTSTADAAAAEHDEMTAASDALLKLKTEKLGWPLPALDTVAG
jgi:hypothetical protein